MKKKIATALAGGALFLSTLAPAAFAHSYASNSYQNMSYQNSSSYNSYFNMSNFNGNTSFSLGQGKLLTLMSGGQEVPGPGDPDALGFAKLRINPNAGQVCATIKVFNISTPTAAHIHQGTTGQAGPIVVMLPTPDANGRASGCTSVDSGLAQDIINNPTNYYVNVHTTDYPDGALRGQL